jgi:predicted DNA-binding protein YlxM (UPF0122 family)
MPRRIIPLTKNKGILSTRRDCVKQKIIIVKMPQKSSYTIKEVRGATGKSLEEIAYDIARTYLISLVPILGEINKAYLFTEFAYKHIIKFQSEYKKTRDIKTAIMNMMKDMAVETTINYTGDMIKVFENGLWIKFKSQYHKEIENKTLEEAIKEAMCDTILEIISELKNENE